VRHPTDIPRRTLRTPLCPLQDWTPDGGAPSLAKFDKNGSLGRGLHAFTFRLNVSAFYGIGGAPGGYSGGVYEVSGCVESCLRSVIVS